VTRDEQRLAELPKGPLTDGRVKPAGGKWRRHAARIFGFAGFLLASLQLYLLNISLQETRELEASPIVYGEVVSDRLEYRPGDLITFRSVRYVKPTAKQPLPILLLTIDSFENQDTGEVFSAQMASRIVREEGERHFKATRRIPPDCTPGTYVFEGWASSQTSRMSRAVAYSSNTFTIRPAGP
jgi:hypothetical protein